VLPCNPQDENKQYLFSEKFLDPGDSRLLLFQHLGGNSCIGQVFEEHGHDLESIPTECHQAG